MVFFNMLRACNVGKHFKHLRLRKKMITRKRYTYCIHNEMSSVTHTMITEIAHKLVEAGCVDLVWGVSSTQMQSNFCAAPQMSFKDHTIECSDWLVTEANAMLSIAQMYPNVSLEKLDQMGMLVSI